MSLKVGSRSQPAPELDSDRSPPQSSKPVEPTTPAEKKSEGWLAGIARAGERRSESAAQMRGWVAGKVRAMESATAPGPDAGLPQKALHFGATVAGGAVESLAKLPSDYLDAKGKVMQLADPATRARAVDSLRQLAANPSAVVSTMAADAWKEATERPGHTLGGAATLLAPFGAAKLLGAGRAAEAAAAAARVATATADAERGAQVAKSVLTEPARAAVAQFDRLASARNADIAQLLQRPRPAAQLLSDLTKANPNNFMGEGLSVLKHPAEMRTAAHAYLSAAQSGMTGMSQRQAASAAMENLRHGVQRFALPEQHAQWTRVLDELSTTLPR